MTETADKQHEQHESLRGVEAGGVIPDLDMLLRVFNKPSEFSNCLGCLLEQLEWLGHPRHLAEALPHFAEAMDLTSLRNVMVELGYSSKPLRVSLAKMDERLYPCLYIPDTYSALVVLEKKGNQILVFNGITGDKEWLDAPAFTGTAYLFRPIDEDAEQQANVTWFRAILIRFKPLFYEMLLVGLILNCFILAMPLFIMTVYDKVIASGSIPMLNNFTIGVVMAMVGSLILQGLRTRIISFIGARLDHIVGNVIFERLLYLAPSMTENAALGAQVARIKDFDTVRDFFTGALFSMLFELPFALLFLYVIWIIAGNIAIVPVVMIALLGIITLFMEPMIQRSVHSSSRASAKKQAFQLETINNLETIKYSAAEDTWAKRYREISAEATATSFRASMLSGIATSLSDAVMTLSGLSVIMFGVAMVFKQELTVGGLIATMMLVWRVVGPVKSFFSSLTRLSQVATSVRQINMLMNLKPERSIGKKIFPIQTFVGRVEFNRVSFRYNPQLPPALIGVSFTIKPGEIVCITGHNGSGKSTLLKLIPHIYSPQAGSIFIDNQDIRQQDPIELRHAIAYLPQINHFFYGTIEQNLRLAKPTATVKDIIAASNKAGIFADIMRLPDKFQTRLRDNNSCHLSPQFLQRLALARTYIKDAGIMLFDEPGNALDYQGDQLFVKAMDGFRGKKTAIIVTHRPSHLKMADRIVYLEQGQVVLNGPPEQVLPKILKD